MPTNQIRAIRKRQQNRPQQQGYHCKQPDDQRLLGVELLLKREADDHRDQNTGKQDSDAHGHFRSHMLGRLGSPALRGCERRRGQQGGTGGTNRRK